MELVISALQTFAVLFLACGVYLATHRESRPSDAPESESAAPVRGFWRESTALADDKPIAQIHSGSAR
jgi:hypothetical protein